MLHLQSMLHFINKDKFESDLKPLKLNKWMQSYNQMLPYP